MDANPDLRLDDEEHDGVVFLGALRAAFSRVPIWLLTWAVFLLLALMAALPWYDFYESAVGNRYEPGALVSSLDRTLLGDVSDTSFRFDHDDEISALNEKTAATGTLLAFGAILLGMFAAGGWLQIILERTRGQSVRRFFFGGARYFFRFLRLLVLSLLILAVFGWVIYGKPWEHFVLGDWLGVPGYDRDSLETLDSEWTFVQLKWAQAALYALVRARTLASLMTPSQRVTLSLDVPTLNHEYTYQHSLPSDFLRIVRTHYEAEGYASADYRIEGLKLVSDDSTVKIEYIAKITDVSQFDALFVDVLAQRLAAEMAVALLVVLLEGLGFGLGVLGNVQALVGIGDELVGKPRVVGLALLVVEGSTLHGGGGEPVDPLDDGLGRRLHVLVLVLAGLLGLAARRGVLLLGKILAHGRERGGELGQEPRLVELLLDDAVLQASGVALPDHATAGADERGVGNGCNAVCLPRGPVFDEERVLGLRLLDERLDGGLGLARHAQDDEASLGVLVLQLVQVTHLTLAGASGGADELVQQDTPAQLGERHGVAVDHLLHHPLRGGVTDVQGGVGRAKG